jgi:hypothetical protein
MPVAIIEAVVAWADKNGVSRSEAIRHLVEAGLATASKRGGAQSGTARAKPTGGHTRGPERKRQPKLIANPDEVKGG